MLRWGWRRGEPQRRRLRKRDPDRVGNGHRVGHGHCFGNGDSHGVGVADSDSRSELRGG